jgi:hypothetical protein
MSETYQLDQVVAKPTVTGFTLPSSVQSSDLDWENSVGFPMTKDKMIVFAPSVGLLGSDDDAGALLKGPMMAGVIITDQNKVLVMESEPIGEGNFGWTAYLSIKGKERKAILSGQGKVTAQKDGSSTVESSVNTVYDNISASPGCSAMGKVTTTGGGGMPPKVMAEVTFTIN